MDKNICKHTSALCQRKHENCGGCVIFWGIGGWRSNSPLHNRNNVKSEYMKNHEDDEK